MRGTGTDNNIFMANQFQNHPLIGPDLKNLIALSSCVIDSNSFGVACLDSKGSFNSVSKKKLLHRRKVQVLVYRLMDNTVILILR